MISLSRDEQKTVYAVFNTLKSKPYDELISLLGSETIKRMIELNTKIEDHLVETGDIRRLDPDDDDWDLEQEN